MFFYNKEQQQDVTCLVLNLHLLCSSATTLKASICQQDKTRRDWQQQPQQQQTKENQNETCKLRQNKLRPEPHAYG